MLESQVGLPKMNPLSPLLATVKPVSANAGNRDSPEKVAKAAQDFEALLIEQMLKSVRESNFGGGWASTEQDQAANTALDLADQQMAQLMARAGGLGLSKIIAAGLKPNTANGNLAAAPGHSSTHTLLAHPAARPQGVAKP